MVERETFPFFQCLCLRPAVGWAGGLKKKPFNRCQMLSFFGRARGGSPPRRFATSRRTEPVPFGPLRPTRAHVRPSKPKRLFPRTSDGRLAVSYMMAAAAACAGSCFFRSAWAWARSPLLKNAIFEWPRSPPCCFAVPKKNAVPVLPTPLLCFGKLNSFLVVRWRA